MCALAGLVVTKPGRFVVSSREGSFYDVECSLESGALTMSLSSVQTSLNFTHNSCFGLAASEHRMIWFAVTS